MKASRRASCASRPSRHGLTRISRPRPCRARQHGVTRSLPRGLGGGTAHTHLEQRTRQRRTQKGQVRADAAAWPEHREEPAECGGLEPLQRYSAPRTACRPPPDRRTAPRYGRLPRLDRLSSHQNRIAISWQSGRNRTDLMWQSRANAISSPSARFRPHALPRPHSA